MGPSASRLKTFKGSRGDRDRAGREGMPVLQLLLLLTVRSYKPSSLLRISPFRSALSV